MREKESLDCVRMHIWALKTQKLPGPLSGPWTPAADCSLRSRDSASLRRQLSASEAGPPALDQILDPHLYGDESCCWWILLLLILLLLIRQRFVNEYCSLHEAVMAIGFIRKLTFMSQKITDFQRPQKLRVYVAGKVWRKVKF